MSYSTSTPLASPRLAKRNSDLDEAATVLTAAKKTAVMSGRRHLHDVGQWVILAGFILVGLVSMSKPSPTPVVLLPETVENLEALISKSCSDSRIRERPGTEKGPAVQFVHVPKAGGTSIQTALMKWAKTSNIDVTLKDHGGPYWGDGKIRRGVLLGHRGFGFAKGAGNLVEIVAFREPLSRVISLFDYLNSLQDRSPLLMAIRKSWNGKSLDQVIASYNATRVSSFASLLPGGNASHSDRSFHRVLQSQLQFMCGYECVFLLTGSPDEQVIPTQVRDPKVVFNRAIENLKKTECIGVLAHLDDLIVQMKHHLGFVPPNVVKFPFENTKHGKKSKLSDGARALLQEWLKEEIVMYQFAEKLSAAKTRHARDCLKQG